MKLRILELNMLKVTQLKILEELGYKDGNQET